MQPLTYSEVVLVKRPTPGTPVTEDCFKLAENQVFDGNIDASASSSYTVLVQVTPLWISVDPYLRCQFDEKMPPGVDYITPFKLNAAVRSLAVGKITKIVLSEGESQTQYSEGDLVLSEGMLGWPWRSTLLFSPDVEATSNSSSSSSSFVEPASLLHVLPKEAGFTDESCAHALGVFGATGLTAYFGVLREMGLTAKNNVTATNAPETPAAKVIVISSAAGATGIIASQIARTCVAEKTFVVGLTSSDSKIAALNSVGAVDAAVNYKAATAGSNSLASEILKATGGRPVDIFFDCVGGDVASAVLETLNDDGTARVVLCGQVSTYNDGPDVPYPPPLPEKDKEILAAKKVKRERYLVLKYAAEFEQAQLQLIQWVAVTKQVLPVQTVFSSPAGLQGAGAAFSAMMRGENVGKMIVKV